MRKQTHNGIAGNIGGVYHGGGDFATGDLPRKFAENISEWESEFQERRTEKTNEREESSVEALFSGPGTLRPGPEIFDALA